MEASADVSDVFPDEAAASASAAAPSPAQRAKWRGGGYNRDGVADDAEDCDDDEWVPMLQLTPAAAPQPLPLSLISLRIPSVALDRFSHCTPIRAQQIPHALQPQAAALRAARTSASSGG